MSFFSQGSSTFGSASTGGMFGANTNTNYNAMKDIEVLILNMQQVKG